METIKTEVLVCNLVCHGTLECYSFDDLLHSTDFIYKKKQTKPKESDMTRHRDLFYRYLLYHFSIIIDTI
jgi:hypothetical protein